MGEVVVTDVRERGRYEAHLDGALAGFAQYRRNDDVIVFVHTQVDPAFEGRGIGSALARTSLDAARAGRLRVDPQCPFYAAWIGKHPEYADLVADPA